MTNEQEQKLIESAKDSIKNAFTGTNQVDDFRIAASVLTSGGNIYGSGQYVSDTYTLTIHAEQAAMMHSASHGEYAIEAIAVVANKTAFSANNGELIYPCHLCKQFVYESYLRSGVNTEFLILNSEGQIGDRFRILDVMDKPWPISPYVKP